MGFFEKLFRRQAKVKTEAKNLPSFWEDDYCQIEIVPRKNVEHIDATVKQIAAFTEAKNTAFGFTDVFVRKGLPFSTLGQEFRVDTFESFLSSKGFVKREQILYNGRTVIDCSRDSSNAFSLSNFLIFYDCQGDFIKNIWISNSHIVSNDQFKIILETLYDLGESYEFVLVDWNSLELVNLADKKQIKEYL